MQTSRTLCQNVNRKSWDSSDGFMPVAAAATAMLCTLIILPITPPAELAAAVRTGFRPTCLAAVVCRLPKIKLLEASDPLRNTPIHPSSELKKEKNAPVVAKAGPRVEFAPE